MINLTSNRDMEEEALSTNWTTTLLSSLTFTRLQKITPASLHNSSTSRWYTSSNAHLNHAGVPAVDRTKNESWNVSSNKMDVLSEPSPETVTVPITSTRLISGTISTEASIENLASAVTLDAVKHNLRNSSTPSPIEFHSLNKTSGWDANLLFSRDQEMIPAVNSRSRIRINNLPSSAFEATVPIAITEAMRSSRKQANSTNGNTTRTTNNGAVTRKSTSLPHETSKVMTGSFKPTSTAKTSTTGIARQTSAKPPSAVTESSLQWFTTRSAVRTKAATTTESELDRSKWYKKNRRVPSYLRNHIRRQRLQGQQLRERLLQRLLSRTAFTSVTTTEMSKHMDNSMSPVVNTTKVSSRGMWSTFIDDLKKYFLQRF
ncbi:unnamed protein product [Toxocara canis]|uniref:Uncharacterized protein n=1 Tax=Toxocara canis TaxID=6265 RepID=A0A183VCV4_TOXCA|nr:unnamed protein product [Toxocara canis]